MTDPCVEVEGEVYRILSVGRYSAGAVYCHLASTTRFVPQRNGPAPAQIATYVEAAKLEAALNRPRGFYSWNRSLRGAYERGERDAAAGKTEADCPYKDARRCNGQLTWSRAYRSAWRDGYYAASVRARASTDTTTGSG